MLRGRKWDQNVEQDGKKPPTSSYSIVLFQWVGELGQWAKAPDTKLDT